MLWQTLTTRFAGMPAARWLADTVIRHQARRSVRALDRETRRCQVRTLLGLVHRGEATRFGYDHDFRRIRTTRDFQRLVPLRTLPQLWQEYWPSPSFHLGQSTWPLLPFLALSDGARDWFSSVPLSNDALAAYGAAALTVLGFMTRSRPHARFLAGRTLILGKDTGITDLGGLRAGSLEAVAVARLPAFIRRGVEGPIDPDREAGAWRDTLTRFAQPPVTCVVGRADRLARLFARLRRETGRDRVADLWPELEAVVFARHPSSPKRAVLVDAVGNARVLFLEAWLPPEGGGAVEDPRYGLLRLLMAHGTFFEFIPPGEITSPFPLRHTLREVEIGVPYAVAVTSRAGVWACLVESQVCFERRDPPLIRLLEKPAPAESRPARRLAGQPANLGFEPTTGRQPVHRAVPVPQS